MPKSSFIPRVAAIAGLALGAFALSALAGTWTAPTGAPPSGNPDAPINVGLTTQTKTGWLALRGLIASDFTLATGTPAAGKVLTAIDSLGNATWATPSSGAGGVVVSQEYVLNNSSVDSQTVNMGVHKICFLKGISGFETDSGRIGCYITTETDGSHTLNKWRAVCRAACID